MKRSNVNARTAGPQALIAAAGIAALLLVAPHAGRAGPGPEAVRVGDMLQPGGEQMGMAGWGMHPRVFERMAGELGLSEPQRQSIEGLFESACPAIKQRREQMRANAELLRRTEPGDRDYQAVVERVSRSAGELAARAVSDAAQLRAQIWAVLTPEQRTTLRQLQEQRRSRFEERRKLRQQRMEQWRGAGRTDGTAAQPQG